MPQLSSAYKGCDHAAVEIKKLLPIKCLADKGQNLANK